VNDNQAIMLTSASAGDGKTTTAINLGLTIAAAGQPVILIDLDMRNPELMTTLGLEPRAGLLAVGGPAGGLADQLLPVPGAPLMSVIGLPRGLKNTPVVDDLGRDLSMIIAEAKKLVDFVLVDTSPLGEVSDPLRVAPHVNRIVVVTRPGNTRRAHFRVMRDLLDRAGYVPEGLVVIGGSSALTHGYYGVPGRAEPERADGGSSARIREA
jgi:Mrp family chromosome partitioning ATPase